MYYVWIEGVLYGCRGCMGIKGLCMHGCRGCLVEFVGIGRVHILMQMLSPHAHSRDSRDIIGM